ncbi:MAG: YfhO family protein [Eubacterium sp.]|jgi:uncharacterized membrane protein YfhO
MRSSKNAALLSSSPESRPSVLGKAAPYLIIAAAMLAAVFWLTEGGKYIYGTLGDWEIQHTAIPELLRRQFYQTGNLFPDFIPSVGGGENAYYFSYYGLLSPVVLLSYLFPFLRMRTYLMGAAILTGILAPCLIYRWLSRSCRPAAALTAALLFEFAAGFFHHGHYHIMFIYYMPFLIMALQALEGQIRQGKGSAGFVIWMSLTILCCYYFAIAEFAAAGVYAIYLGLRRPAAEDSAVKRAFRAVLKMIPGSILTVMVTAVLWLPTLYALAGRSQSQTTVSLKELLTPVFHGEYMMYDVDSMGVTAFFLAAVCFFLLTKNAGARWLAVIFLLLSFCSLPVFVMNGGMYVHGKVLFAFLPLAAMMEAEFLEKIQEGNAAWKKLFLLLLPLGALCYFTFGSKYRACFLADFCLTVVVLVVFAAGERRPLLIRTGMAVLLIPALVVTMSINQRKSMIKRGGTIAVPQFHLARGTYRTGYLMADRSPFNLPAGNGQYLASIYSSVSNPYYGRYYHSLCGNNVRCRNSAMMEQTKNPYFCAQMGVRYLISRSPYTAPENYQLVKTIRNYRLYENKNVLPIAYTSGREFNPRQQKAKTITVPGMKTTYRIHSKVLQEKILNLKPSDHARIITISGSLKNYRTRSKVKFGIWQRRQMIQDHKGDVRISVNYVLNTRTSPNAIYGNWNKTFTYTLFIPAHETELHFRFHHGNYALENIRVTEGSAEALNQSVRRVRAAEIDQKQSPADILVTKGTFRKGDTLWTTIPYDHGFTASVDGKSVSVSKSRLGFVKVFGNLSEGDHKIVLTYHAPGKRIGEGISLLGLILTVGMAFLRRKIHENTE